MTLFKRLRSLVLLVCLAALVGCMTNDYDLGVGKALGDSDSPADRWGDEDGCFYGSTVGCSGGGDYGHRCATAVGIYDLDIPQACGSECWACPREEEPEPVEDEDGCFYGSTVGCSGGGDYGNRCATAVGIYDLDIPQACGSDCWACPRDEEPEPDDRDDRPEPDDEAEHDDEPEPDDDPWFPDDDGDCFHGETVGCFFGLFGDQCETAMGTYDLESAQACGSECEVCPGDTAPDPADDDGERDGLCSNSCAWAGDGECDDGGPGSDYDVCAYGTDCDDCGAR